MTGTTPATYVFELNVDRGLSLKFLSGVRGREPSSGSGELYKGQWRSDMSMEICILSDIQLKSISEWQQAVDLEGFPLRLCYEKPFAELRGFVPSILRDKQTGFECYHVDPRELIETYDDIQFGREWKYAIELVWGGNFAEMQAACMAAAAYARATSGIVFDPQASQLLTASQAVEMVQDNERVLPQLEAGTREIKARR